jgi:hypothetical protein
MKLFVDDLRTPYGYFEDALLVKTYDEAIRILSTQEIDKLSLDHDLGEEKTGYDIAKWIEQKVAEDENYMPPTGLRCHSQNTVGKRNIERAFFSILKILAKREESP